MSDATPASAPDQELREAIVEIAMGMCDDRYPGQTKAIVKELYALVNREREKAVREAFATENAINNENFSPIPPTYFDRAQNAVLESMFPSPNAQ